MFVSMYHITTKVSIFSLTAYTRASIFLHMLCFSFHLSSAAQNSERLIGIGGMEKSALSEA